MPAHTSATTAATTRAAPMASVKASLASVASWVPAAPRLLPAPKAPPTESRAWPASSVGRPATFPAMVDR